MTIDVGEDSPSCTPSKGHLSPYLLVPKMTLSTHSRPQPRPVCVWTTPPNPTLSDVTERTCLGT